jgi:hypothetical protein
MIQQPERLAWPIPIECGSATFQSLRLSQKLLRRIGINGGPPQERIKLAPAACTTAVPCCGHDN